jgi:hypothetical protein
MYICTYVHVQIIKNLIGLKSYFQEVKIKYSSRPFKPVYVDLPDIYCMHSSGISLHFQMLKKILHKYFFSTFLTFHFAKAPRWKSSGYLFHENVSGVLTDKDWIHLLTLKSADEWIIFIEVQYMLQFTRMYHSGVFFLPKRRVHKAW